MKLLKIIQQDEENPLQTDKSSKDLKTFMNIKNTQKKRIDSDRIDKTYPK